MKTPIVRSRPRARLMGALALSLLTAAPLALTPLVLAAPDATPVIKAQLQAFKVVPQKDGDEKFASAAIAQPGDVIEYQATYSNDGKRAATNLNATLPIPAALSYVPNTAQPGGFMASTDAKTFAAAPLQRRVKDANGKTVLVMVPFSEYRALRWKLDSLAPGADFKVSARAAVPQPGAAR